MKELIWGFIIGAPLGIALGILLNRLIHRYILKPRGYCSVKDMIEFRKLRRENDSTKR